MDKFTHCSATNEDILKATLDCNLPYVITYNTREQPIFDKNWCCKEIQE